MISSRIKKRLLALTALCLLLSASPLGAQQVLFDFDNAPIHSPLPISLTVNGITAHFSATGEGYSIQAADVLGFKPQGFSGNCIYPNSIYLADLLIKFDQKITDFSILYACQELGCDDAATMRATAYYKGNELGSKTKTAGQPGTWPSDVLSCSFQQGFDSVVVHYDKKPPTCQDYGLIFMADNMNVTPANVNIIPGNKPLNRAIVFNNPKEESATMSFSLYTAGNVHIALYDMTGRFVKEIYNGALGEGEHLLTWPAASDIQGGIYLLSMSVDQFSWMYKIAIMK